MDKLNPEKGFSIIEILIAMALMLIVVSGAIAGSGGLGVTINGYSSTISDSEINSEALHKAQDLIEQAAATARTSYSSVASSTSFELSSGLSYLKKLTIPVAYATQCMETVVGTVSWTGSHGRTLSVSASTTVVDVPGMFAYGGDCDITLPEDWDNPTTAASVSLGGQGATDVDADGDLVYLSSAASAPAKSDFYIYRFDTSALTLTELTSGGLNTGKGINTLDIAESYAYAANNDTTGQLLVLDVSNYS
jgi:prepilin-type N-terminal cleavage/methylation domain-containing protein